MSEPTQVYWDTSCFLCFLNRAEEERRKICEDILYHAQNGSVRLWTSTWTIVEVVRPKKLASAKKLTADQILKIQAMFQWPFLKKIQVDERVAAEAVRLARDFGLRPADAVHAASAILRKVAVLQRWDRDFDKIGSLITVEEPRWMSAQQTLIDGFRRPIGPEPEKL